MAVARATKTLALDAFLLHHAREQGAQVTASFEALLRRSGHSSIVVISEIPQRHLVLSDRLLERAKRALKETRNTDDESIIDKRLELLSKVSLASAFQGMMDRAAVRIVECEHMGLHKISSIMDKILINADISIKDRMQIYNAWHYLSDQITFQRSQSMADVAFQQRIAAPGVPMVIMAGGQHVYDIECMRRVTIGDAEYAVEISRLNGADFILRDMQDRDAFYNALRASMESDGQVSGTRAGELAEALVLATELLLRDIRQIADSPAPLWIASSARERLRAFVREVHSIVPE